jgi:hypothetical protein
MNKLSRFAIPAFSPERAADISRWFHHRESGADTLRPRWSAGPDFELQNFFPPSSCPAPHPGRKGNNDGLSGGSTTG